MYVYAFAYAAAAVLFLVFLVGVVRDRRRFSHAVILGLALSALSFGLMSQLAVMTTGPWFDAVLLAVVLIPALGVVLLACFLVSNGVQMVRKEGRRPANLLSLLAGLGIFGVMGLAVAAAFERTGPLTWIAASTLLVTGYVSFLFLCFVGYAFLYGRLRINRHVDFVVVLGSGLRSGAKVPPLLASRLHRARSVYEKQAARGKPPVVVTSGGQGPDELLPESHAMANFLIGRGLPEEHIRREDRSRTTDENLRLSMEIMAAEKPDYRCVIVTNNFHVLRAALVARETGVRGQVIGSPTAAYFWPSATIREFAAVFLAHRPVNFGICLVLAVAGAFV
ncbi:YdcF family protein [Streptomyces sp. NBC_01498]|uniref:YdcF family protein n=1 Tax=Streptomyces sp. NBC_01498 TaxID=2975870 RepID=UPI002E7BDD78|nr:YdcF family protein [Streptomyces sp. NBC_01498]WTL25542.1 YdcF family protein [Streptomyces sp. NBC_01498]